MDSVRIFLGYTLLEFTEKIGHLKRYELAELYWYLKIRLTFPELDFYFPRKVRPSNRVPRLSQLAERSVSDHLASSPIALIRTRLPEEESFPRTSPLPELRKEIIRLLEQFLNFPPTLGFAPVHRGEVLKIG
jgi:hypothetical protein